MAELKDRGTEWLREIPDSWRLSRIGSVYELRNTKVSDKEYPPLSVTNKGIVPQLQTAAKTNAHDNRKLVKKGDFAINSRSDRRGSCGISAYEGSVSLINTILAPLGKMNPCYYDWLFHTIQFGDEFYKWGHGIVDDLWTTNWQDMKKITIPNIADNVKRLKHKKFAVIIDEAHSSTAGKNMAAVTMTLGNGDELAYDTEDMIVDQISKQGKQANVSMFAFTATPKPTTIQLFGRENTNGQKEAFHFYTMKQAIEEGFILDVLDNYLNYETYYKLNKEIEEDPTLQTNEAKRQIARFIQLHEVNIAQRVEIIIEHFRTPVMQELGGHAKAMVVTESRAGAVKYRQAFEDYTKKKGYTNIRALVAFSGKVTLADKEYTEAGMNGISEKNLPDEFDKDEYQVLLVADKYQTGFDQPKLCAMYILKKLHGVTAVQTLSRLNRICPPYEKKTFVLDFVNKYEDIVAAFSKYYTKTVLSNLVTPRAIYDIEAKIDGYFFLDPADVESFNKVLYESAHTAKDILIPL